MKKLFSVIVIGLLLLCSGGYATSWNERGATTQETIGVIHKDGSETISGQKTFKVQQIMYGIIATSDALNGYWNGTPKISVTNNYNSGDSYGIKVNTQGVNNFGDNYGIYIESSGSTLENIGLRVNNGTTQLQSTEVTDLTVDNIILSGNISTDSGNIFASSLNITNTTQTGHITAETGHIGTLVVGNLTYTGTSEDFINLSSSGIFSTTGTVTSTANEYHSGKCTFESLSTTSFNINSSTISNINLTGVMTGDVGTIMFQLPMTAYLATTLDAVVIGRDFKATKTIIKATKPPVGASLKCDVNKNGTSIYGNAGLQAILASAETTATDTCDATFVAGDVISWDIDQTGTVSWEAGGNFLMLTVIGIKQ